MANSFAAAMKSESNKTFTANGATAYSSTGNALLDLFSAVGSMRNAPASRIETMLADGFAEDQLLATKTMFYTRDIRGERVGKGERQTFRVMLKWMAKHHPNAVIPNIPLIGVYGRFDDLYTLIDTPCEKDMWAYVKEQFNTDVANMEYNQANPDGKKKPVSLLGKWLKSVNSSSKETCALGRTTAKNIGFSKEKDYRKALAALRAYIPVLERQMSDGCWTDIDFERVPAKAMKTYKNAFAKHDVGNFTKYVEDVKEGKAKINASTLFPYDIVGEYFNKGLYDHKEDDILEAQWKAMPDYVGKDVNAVVVCDTSGSMTISVNGVKALPLKAAISLAIYFAEHNTGTYHNMFMEFSSKSRFVTLHGETLLQKIQSAYNADWGMSTNLEAAFMKILDTAIKNNVDNNEMPKSIIVISDMQINHCTGSWSFYHEMKARYARTGYDIPHVIFWNVNAAQPTMLVDDKTREGVQLISGLNAKTFAEIIDNASASSIELMLNCLNNPRYDAVTVA